MLLSSTSKFLVRHSKKYIFYLNEVNFLCAKKAIHVTIAESSSIVYNGKKRLVFVMQCVTDVGESETPRG